jgi:hypothetical protein
MNRAIRYQAEAGRSDVNAAGIRSFATDAQRLSLKEVN